MRIRLGYVAMALNIPDGSPNKTVTATNLAKIPERENRIARLQRLTKTNLDSQMRVLRYNKAYQVHMFRFTSRLVPLATHPLAEGWDYLGEMAAEWKQIGDYVKENGMRVSAHPDHFSLLNSPKQEVMEATLADLEYHAGLFAAMGLGPEAKLVLHVGGYYKDKQQAVDRFKHNFLLLPAYIKDRIVLENDDRSYTASEVLAICRELAIPMVLDVHHHACCNQGEKLEELLPAIFRTWCDLPPKVHFSSPKEGANNRAHADFIRPDEFQQFLEMVSNCWNGDFDVMLEAKQKDKALFALMQELSQYPGIRLVEQAAIEY